MKAWIVLTVLNLMAGAATAAPQIDMDYVHAEKSGGETTVFFKGQSIWAFRNPAANLSKKRSLVT